MRARLCAFPRSIVYVVILLAALLSGGGQRIAAQGAPMRWDGFFELISGRWPYAPPWAEGLYASDAENRVSRHPISADGRYVIFDSDATNMGYSTPAVYLRDRDTGQTEVFLGGPMREVALSASGDHVAGVICDPWMRFDLRPICDIWGEHVGVGGIVPLSTMPDGTLSDADSSEPVLSANGRFVAFVTRAANLSGGPGGVRQIVLRDRDSDGNGIFDEPGTAVLQTISANAASGLTGDNDSDTPEVSDDGRFVAFRSLASNLVDGDTNATWDVFVRDRLTGEVQRINVGPERQQSTSSVDWGQLSMSADGRFVAFASEDGLLAPATQDDTNGVLDVFVYDRENPAFLVRVDIMPGWPIAGGYILGNGPTSWPQFSADGRYLAVQSKITTAGAPPSDRNQVYVVDRARGNVTRISVKPNGDEPTEECARPAISGDGSVVLFMSKATDLVGLANTAFDQLFAAVHLEIAPTEAIVPGRGGRASFIVTTQPHTLWWASWDFNEYWFASVQAPYSVGSGVMTFEAREANPDSAQRSMTIRVGQSTATFTQDVGVSLTSVSPSSGPMSGGTLVTLRGTGFEPGMSAYFGQMVPTEFVDSTTLRAVTPPSTQRGFTMVGVNTSDYRYGVIENGFFYLDSTPPEVYGWADGYRGPADWFISDAAVTWNLWDQESEITSTTCAPFTVATDTPGTTFTCSATSEGGTGYGSVTVKRDATPPIIAVTTPSPRQLFELGASVPSAFACSDATSGIANCGLGAPSGTPLDTSSSGWKTFFADALDAAGNRGTSTVEYAVSTGACAYPPPDLVGWWRFEGDTVQWMNSAPRYATRVGLTSDVFVNGVVGQAYQFEGADGYLNTGFAPRWWSDERFAIAGWLKPTINTRGTIVRASDGYAVARLATGSIAWAFRKYNVPGLAYFDTGVKVPLNVWTHVTVVLDNTTVSTHINGRLAHTATNIGDVYNSDFRGVITLGGGEGVGDYFKGALDEVQVFDHGLDALQVEQLFLSGAEGTCVHRHTAFEIVNPLPAGYGDETYPIDARLVDESGAPVVGRAVTIQSQLSSWPASTWYGHVVTDLDGRVHWDAPVHGASWGLHEDIVLVTFEGDTDYTRLTVARDVLVGKGTPRITWPEPAPITYGTRLSSTQLNATATVEGTFTYSPPAGSVLDAGAQTLTTTFTPTYSGTYNTVSASVPLAVNKAVTTIAVSGGSFVYDGAAHPATGTVKNQSGVVVGTPTFGYNGSLEPPVNPGTYEVVATYAGSANCDPAPPATVTLTITKASPVVLVTPATFVYDAQPHPATVTVTGIGGISLGPVTITYNGSPDPPVNAGSYEAIASYVGDSYYAAVSASGLLVIQRASPVLSWQAPAPIVYGTALSNAQLNASAAIPGFFSYSPEWGTLLGAGGGQVLTATFTPADALNYSSGSVSTRIDVARAAASVAVTGGTFVYDGQPHAATGTVIGVGGVSLGSPTLTYNGGPSAPVNAGSYSVVGSFAGNANYEPGSATATITITPAAPVLSWAPPDPIVYGTPIGANQMTATASVPGTFSYQNAGYVFNAGTGWSLIAAFTPADWRNYASGYVETTISVLPAPLIVRANDATKPFGAPLPPFSAVFAGLVNGDSPASLAGRLVFSTTATPTSPAGTYAIVPSGLLSPNYTIGFANGILTIVKGAVIISTSASPEPSGLDMRMTFTATVAAEAPAAGSPSGSISFYEGTTRLGTAPVSGGSATLSTAGIDAGSHTIEARYDGDDSFESGTGSVAHLVNTVETTPSLSVTSSRNPASFGTSVTLTAAVSLPGAIVSGTVAFYNGATLIGSSPISAGRATLVTTALPLGSNAITARYLGSADVPPTISPVFVQAISTTGWKNRSTTTAIGSSMNPSVLDDPLVFTATVIGGSNSAPTGRVLFTIDGEVYGDPAGVPVALVSGTTVRASLSIPNLAHGRHKVTATYLGDDIYRGSTAGLTQTVN